MYWFKNAIIYRLTKNIDFTHIEDALQDCKFTPCDSHDMSSFGWFPPLAESTQLHFQAQGRILLVACRETKILPHEVINREFTARVNAFEEQEQRKLKKSEKQHIKDDVVSGLIPRAFSRQNLTALYIDTARKLIYVSAASNSRAEDALGLLRKSLGSLPVTPLSLANDPSAVLTDWIAGDNVPQWLTLTGDGKLKSTEDNSEARFKQQDFESSEINTLLQNGKTVTELSLHWENHLTFTLTEKSTLKGLKFTDDVREKNDDIPKDDLAQRFDADFVLMTGILATLTDHLSAGFSGENRS